MRTVLLTLAVVVLLAGLGGLAFVYSGIYNVAATVPHNALSFWLLNTASDRSIQNRAARIEAPDLRQPGLVERGAILYREECVRCHGAPGIGMDPIGRGLEPLPPRLEENARHWSPEALFWIVKHGIKMTGMPAWGPSYDDDDIWALVAFMQEMPGMMPRRYRGLAGGSPPGIGAPARPSDRAPRP